MDEEKIWRENVPVNIINTVDYINYAGIDTVTMNKNINELAIQLLDVDKSLQDYIIEQIKDKHIQREVAEELARVSWTLKLLDINGRV